MPLSNLLRKTSFIWSHAQRQALESLNQVLTTELSDSDNQEYFDGKTNTLVLDNKRILQMVREQSPIIHNTLWAVNRNTSNVKNNQDFQRSCKFLEKVIDYNQGPIQNLTLIFHQQREILRNMSLMQELIHEIMQCWKICMQHLTRRRSVYLNKHLKIYFGMGN